MAARDVELIERITSLQNPRIKQAMRLHSSRGRQTQGRLIVFGRREVERALDAGLEFEEIFVGDSMSRSDLGAIQERTTHSSAQWITVSPDVLAKLTYGDRVDEMVGVANRPRTDLSGLTVSSPALVVVAQAIEKPGNLGAIVRTADACAVGAVLLADPMTDFFHPNSIRSSTAAVFGMPCATGTTAEILGWLNENGFRIFTAQLDGAIDLFDAELTGNVALVLGNEADGLDSNWSNDSFTSVKLPMQGIADSLNVSVTASVMIYEATRQRKAVS
jgi:TrmH family RNA methyltransferase